MFDSPYRLTAVTAACGLLATLGFGGANLPVVCHSLPMLAGCFALVASGTLGMYWNAHTLREAVQNERWPESTLAPLRRVVDHIVWKLLLALLFVAMLVVLVRYWHHRNDLFWSVFLLLQTQTQIGSALASPRRRGAGHRLDWTKMAPLQSEHWGDR